MPIILASQSPRRLELLQAVGIQPKVMPVHINEIIHHGESTLDATMRLCLEKSQACPIQDTPIITADTLVTLHGKAFGQPTDRKHAAHMLEQLAGQTHQVITAVCVRLGTQVISDSVTTGVQFRPISNTEINTYLMHNDIMDKAGAYAVQSGASSFITCIDGPLDNVIGLPVQQTLAMLASLKNLGENR